MKQRKLWIIFGSAFIFLSYLIISLIYRAQQDALGFSSFFDYAIPIGIAVEIFLIGMLIYIYIRSSQEPASLVIFLFCSCLSTAFLFLSSVSLNVENALVPIIGHFGSFVAYMAIWFLHLLLALFPRNLLKQRSILSPFILINLIGTFFCLFVINGVRVVALLWTEPLSTFGNMLDLLFIPAAVIGTIVCIFFSLRQKNIYQINAFLVSFGLLLSFLPVVLFTMIPQIFSLHGLTVSAFYTMPFFALLPPILGYVALRYQLVLHFGRSLSLLAWIVSSLLMLLICYVLLIVLHLFLNSREIMIFFSSLCVFLVPLVHNVIQSIIKGIYHQRFSSLQHEALQTATLEEISTTVINHIQMSCAGVQCVLFSFDKAHYTFYLVQNSAHPSLLAHLQKYFPMRYNRMNAHCFAFSGNRPYWAYTFESPLLFLPIFHMHSVIGLLVVRPYDDEYELDIDSIEAILEHFAFPFDVARQRDHMQRRRELLLLFSFTPDLSKGLTLSSVAQQYAYRLMAFDAHIEIWYQDRQTEDYICLVRREAGLSSVDGMDFTRGDWKPSYRTLSHNSQDTSCVWLPFQEKKGFILLVWPHAYIPLSERSLLEDFASRCEQDLAACQEFGEIVVQILRFALQSPLWRNLFLQKLATIFQSSVLVNHFLDESQRITSFED